jgi:hypothetical protein
MVGPTYRLTQHNLVRIRGGVYIWVNSKTDDKYVGCSITLPIRIRFHYVSKALQGTLGDRPIELGIKEFGLENFRLKLYTLSTEIISLVFSEGLEQIPLTEYRLRMDIVVKVLEQIFILLYNPVLNEIKVVGSNAGQDVSHIRKSTYLYDQLT